MSFLNRRLSLVLLISFAACSPPTERPSGYSHNPGVSDAHGQSRDTTTFYFPADDSLHAAYIPHAQRPPGYVLDERVTNCAGNLVSANVTFREVDTKEPGA